MAAVSSNQLTSGFTLNHRMLYPVLVYISGVNQIELLQHVIYSKHVNWLKVWNFHLSQINSAEFSSRTFHKLSLLRRSSLRGGDQKWEKNHRLPNPESLPRSSRLQAQRLLKNMKFEGIEIAQFQIPSSFQISSSISIPSNFIFFKSLYGGESHKFKLQIYAANKKYR